MAKRRKSARDFLLFIDFGKLGSQHPNYTALINERAEWQSGPAPIALLNVPSAILNARAAGTDTFSLAKHTILYL
jgi:hypothetical protein